ncbi:MAG: hypothetical protein WC052_04105 [Patescibacteria group bacterium]
MDTTIFLAKIWGPVILAVGLGVFVSRSYYIKIYRDLEKETLAVLIFGMVGMAAGIAQVLSHNVWGTLSQIIISLLGWGLLIKGLTFAITPRIVDWSGNLVSNTKLISFVGVFTLVVGAYLSSVGYFGF